MRALQADELERLEGAQVEGMMDACTILALREGDVDEYGQPKRMWTEVELWVDCPCGLNVGARVEVMDGAQMAITDAVLRLPVGAPVDNLSRIEVTRRFGTVLDEPLTFGVIGMPRRGASGLLVNLRTVSDGGRYGG